MITISPKERALLDAIASTEATGYNVMYGHNWSGESRTFDSYADHPRKFWEITSGPNKGKKSSAAGRYQFLGSTWDDIAGRYGLRDFSPASQDMGAIALAREEYRRQTNRNLTVDLESDDPIILAAVGKVLSTKWTSLPSGIEQGQDVDKFVTAIRNPSRSNQSISSAMYEASQSAGGDMLAEYQALKHPTDPAAKDEAPAPDLPAMPETPPPMPRAVAELVPIQLQQIMRRTNYT